jgi:hypothetical protein
MPSVFTGQPKVVLMSIAGPLSVCATRTDPVDGIGRSALGDEVVGADRAHPLGDLEVEVFEVPVHRHGLPPGVEREVGRFAEAGQRHLGAAEEVGADAVGDGFALGDEFGGVELGDDGLEDFVADGGEDAFVVVEAEGLL